MEEVVVLVASVANYSDGNKSSKCSSKICWNIYVFIDNCGTKYNVPRLALQGHEQ